MFGSFFYNLSNNILATPLRIIIGLVFINQGYQNLKADELQEFQHLMFNMESYDLSGFLTGTFSVILIIAGIAVLLGIFVRIIGGLMAFFIITNLLAGFSDISFANMSEVIQLFQDRLILAISSLTLFFLGGGMFCFDSLIFSGVRSAMSSSDDKSSGDVDNKG
ncbi:MAG: DoxX family membrane protein [Desulfobacula sp.]|nr:DoxX family membrane protein [Desulfobacula sp.]